MLPIDAFSGLSAVLLPEEPPDMLAPMQLINHLPKEIEALPRESTVVFLPIAPIQSHGPHLPVGTKAFLSESLAWEASTHLKADGIHVLRAPTLPFAPCQAGSGNSGTFSINTRVYSDFLYEIGQSFQREGFRWLFFVNLNISPDNLRAVADAVVDLGRLKDFAAFDPVPPWLFAPKPRLDAELRRLGTEPERELHGDARETGALLHLDPELLRADIASGLPPVWVNLSWENLKGHFSFQEMGATEGYLGAPALGSSALGALYLIEGGLALAQAVRSALHQQALPELPLAIRLLLKMIDPDESG